MPKPKTYYKRHRVSRILLGYEEREDGTQVAILSDEVSALTTRYYYGLKRKKPHNVYYFGGTWYGHVNAPAVVLPDGTRRDHVHALAPIASATCFDRYIAQTLEQGRAAPVSVTIDQGRLARAVGTSGTPYEGVELLDGTESLDYMEELLDLRPTTKRSRKAAA